MPRSLILDTNVFYNLGSGVLNTASFTQPGDTLYYSPVTVLELAGKWSNQTHRARKDAAQAILSSGATELSDPESYLAGRFGYPLAQPAFSFHQGVVAMAMSTSLTNLVAGVHDLTAWVTRRVSVSTANSWRSTVEGKWVADMLALQRQHVPKFANWYSPDPKKRKGAVPKMRGADKKKFLESTQSTEWFSALLIACQDRALLNAKPGRHLVPTAAHVATLSRAIADVAAYCAIYTQYLIRLMTDGALPEPNDSGDLELLLYSIDDDHIVVTSEKKWKTMATKANCPQRVLKV